MTIELTNKEWLVLNEMLRLAVWNANHTDPIAFEATTDSEYKACCTLWNKIDGKA